MKLRFMLLLALIVFVLMAWAYVKYELETQSTAKLQELSALPVYVYFIDSTMVSVVTEAIQKQPEILSIKHEKGIDVANQTVADFALPIASEQLEGFDIPDVLTILLKPEYASISARPVLVNTIKKYINESDIDAQPEASIKIVTDIQATSALGLKLDMIFALLTLVIFVMGRLHCELKYLLNKRLGKISTLDQMVYKNHLNPHTLMQLFFPPAAIAITYYLLKLTHYITIAIPYYFFILQMGVLIVGTLTTIWLVNNYFQQAILQDDDYGVVMPMGDGIDESERS